MTPPRGDNARLATLAMVLSVCSLLMSAGCGDGRPPRAPVSGQVLIDGKPLGFGYVRFCPKGARAATAKIGPDGRFTLSSFGKDDGVALGTHPVGVMAAETLSPTRQKWHAPKKYADPRTSGLSVTIEGPRDDVTIELSWEGGRPFVEDVKRGE